MLFRSPTVIYGMFDNYDGNLRTQIVTAILALAAVVGAYFFGTSQGSQRKTDILASNQER